MKKQLLFFVMMLLPMMASAHDIEVQNGDGVTIYYNYSNNYTEFAVTFRGIKYDTYSYEYMGNIVIPEEVTYMNITRKVTSIIGGAFYKCSGLTSVTIPSSVTAINGGAFDEIDLSSVISLIENPFKIYGKRFLNGAFSGNTFNNATLYVPKGTIEKYKATEGWMDFAHIEEGKPDGINVVKITKNNKTTIYDLNGVRQPEPKRSATTGDACSVGLKKGIHIVNGKKVVVK
jgi:hypothetical protein